MIILLKNLKVANGFGKHFQKPTGEILDAVGDVASGDLQFVLSRTRPSKQNIFESGLKFMQH